jgi:hypothetical protein
MVMKEVKEVEYTCTHGLLLFWGRGRGGTFNVVIAIVQLVRIVPRGVVMGGGGRRKESEGKKGKGGRAKGRKGREGEKDNEEGRKG